MKFSNTKLPGNLLFENQRLNGNKINLATIHQFSESLGNAIDAKDNYTRCHSVEVAEVSYLIAKRIGFSQEQAEIIHIGGHLHDIGKIGIPDSILKKPGSLTKNEWELMKKHPEIGAQILCPVMELSKMQIPDMVLFHHESFDGTGYPYGLKNNEIPLSARIITLADSLSAILRKRPYKLAKSFEQAEKEIVRFSGIQFDPEIVDVFLDCSNDIKRIFNDIKSELIQTNQYSEIWLNSPVFHQSSKDKF